MRARLRVESEPLAPRMVALGDELGVQQRAAEQHPGQVRLRDWPHDELVTAERLPEDAQLGQSARAGDRADSPDRRSDTGAEQHRRAAERHIDDTTDQRPGGGARQRELRDGQAEDVEAARREHIVAQ